MKQETSAAAKWIVKCIEANGLNQIQLKQFENAIIKLLCEKYEGHWHVDNPRRGQAFRAVLVEKDLIDDMIIVASSMSGIKDIHSRIRRGWTMWIDPGEVEVRDEVTHQNTLLFKQIDTKNRRSPSPVSITAPTNTVTNNVTNNATNNTPTNNNNKTVQILKVSPIIRGKSPPNQGRISPPHQPPVLYNNNNNNTRAHSSPTNNNNNNLYNNNNNYILYASQHSEYYNTSNWNGTVHYPNNQAGFWHAQGTENYYNPYYYAHQQQAVPRQRSPSSSSSSYVNFNDYNNNNVEKTKGTSLETVEQIDLDLYPRDISSRA